MPCNNCQDQSAIISIQGLQVVTQGCSDPCSSCSGGNPIDSTCVIYSGPALSCTGISTKTSLEDIIKAFDEKICTVIGDYSTYNTYCLAPIETERGFVEAISNFVCTLRTDFNYFKDVTFVNYENSVASQFSAINNPGITCSSAGVSPSDSLNTVLQKYCTKFAAIDSSLNVSGANWSQCYTVSPAPSTIVGGFNTLISQICQLKASVAGGAVLPTFNNVGSCLPAPLTSSDSLVDTVNKIKTRLCQTGTFDINALTWNCITKPSTSTTNLQDAVQAILTKIDTLSQNYPTFSGDFSITNVDNTNPCLGKMVSLSSSPYVDKYVAATPSDTSPGTLQDKLEDSATVVFDYATTPGKVRANVVSVSSSDEKVKSDVTDSTPGYLTSKLTAGAPSNGVNIIINLDTSVSDHKTQLSVNVNAAALIAALMQAVSNDETGTLLAQWCSINSQCPSPCSSPTNVIVTYNSGTTTTTSTTTTTTTTP